MGDYFMVKIIHTADLHLGIGSYELYESSYLIQQRFNDFVSNFNFIKEYVISSNADFFIIAGDVFHHPRPAVQAYNEFSRIIGDLLKNNINVIVVLGNHDTFKTREMLSYIKSFENVNLNNFYLFDEASMISLKSKDSNEKVNFIGIPYPHFQSTLRYDEFVQVIERKINDLIQKSEADYNVIVGHLYVEGGKLGSEQRVASLKDYPIPKNVFEKENIDLVCLGHLHMPQKLGDKIYYAGSIERIDFGEENEEKSFFEINLGSKINVNQIKLKLRPMKTIYIEKDSLVSSLDLTQSLIKFLNEQKIEEGSLLRIRIKGYGIIKSISRKSIEDYLYEKRKVLAFKIEEIKEEFKEKEIEFKVSSNIREMLEQYIYTKYKKEPKEVLEKVKEYSFKIIEEMSSYEAQ